MKYTKDAKTFVKISNYIKKIYLDIDYYNSSKKHKIFIVFEIMVVDMLNNKKLELLITELFIKSRKIDTSIAFNMESGFAVSKMID